MRKPTAHYEAALADYLRSRGIPHVAVDETRRSVFAGAKIKSFDFIVYPPSGPSWLVDVKGRQFPYLRGRSRRYWENWVTRADLDGMEKWQAVFADGFVAMLVFAYLLAGAPERWPAQAVHPYAGRYYAFYGIPLAAYREHCRRRSARWETVSLPIATFRRLASPISRQFETP